MSLNLMYHLVPAADFAAADFSRDYIPRAFGREGLIHCTNDREEMARVANAFYRADLRPHLYLYIDMKRVRAPIRYEEADSSMKYPHIYGSLNREAIIAVVPASRNTEGNFLPPEILSAENSDHVNAFQAKKGVNCGE